MELLAPWHLLVLALVALLVLGPKELPNAARQMGRAMQEMRGFRDHLQDQFQGLMDEPDESAGVPAHSPTSPVHTAAAPGAETTEPRS